MSTILRRGGESGAALAPILGVKIRGIAQQSLVLLLGGGEGQARRQAAAVIFEPVERQGGTLGVEEHPAFGVRMFRKVAADEVVVVPQPSRRDVAREQQLTSVLDTAGGQNIDLGAYAEAGAGQAARTHAGDLAGVVGDLNAHAGGVQQAHDPFGASDIVEVDPAEAGRRAELIEVGFETSRVGRDDAGAWIGQVRNRRLHIEIIAPKLADLLGARIIGCEFFGAEWPAAAWNPVPPFEIQGFERTAPAAPAVGVAADHAQLAFGQGPIGQARFRPS